MTDELKNRVEQLSPHQRQLLERLIGGAARTLSTERKPTNETERKLQQIWAEVFGLSEVGVEDNFFDLGGDSIVSIRLVGKAKRSGLQFTTKELFDHPVLTNLAELIESRPQSATPDVIRENPEASTPNADTLKAIIQKSTLDVGMARTLSDAVDAGNIQDVCALSPVQQGILYHLLRDDTGETYLEQTICTIKGPLDVEVFASAWRCAAQSHPILRTAFVWSGFARPLQIVHNALDLTFRRLDWSNLSHAEQSAAQRKLLTSDTQERFDLAVPPLMRFTLAKLAENEHWLVWSSYHLILDAWSLRVLFEEVVAMYRRLGKGELVVATPKPSYCSYVRWLGSLDSRNAMAYWRDRLRGCRPTKLSAGGTGAAEHRQFEILLTEQQTAALYEALSKHNLTLSTVAQAAWAVTTGDYVGSNDVIFGVAVSGRSIAMQDAQSIVGPMLNTVPVRIDLRTDMQVNRWLHELQDEQRRAEHFEYVALSDIHLCSGVPKSEELFDSVLVVLTSVAANTAEANEFTVHDLRARGKSNYSLVVRVAPEPRLRIEVLYRSVFPTEHLERIANRFGELLTTIPQRMYEQLSGMRRSFESIRKSPLQLQPARLSFPRKRPELIKLERRQLIEQGTVGDGIRQIVSYEARNCAMDALGWARANADEIEERIRTTGAVLLRGFTVSSLEEFEQLSERFAPSLMKYRERSTPRTALGGNVYTSTEYPAAESIALHNEFSYGIRWPKRIAFHCVSASEEGGETPVADGRDVLAKLDPAVSDKFAKHGVMYVRNYGRGLDLTWQQAFQTDDPKQVESYCREASIEYMWHGDDRLCTRQVRRAIVEHPLHRQSVWFNQAHLFHVSNLSRAVAAALKSTWAPDELPRNALYGNGAPIEERDLDAVRRAYRASEIVFKWQAGDVLLLDNVLLGHGRRPFTGERKVVVCMGDPQFAPQHAIVN